jgi:hypothetical protein
LNNGPAFKAGIPWGRSWWGVNGRVYPRDLLNHAIKAGKNNSRPIQRLLWRTITIKPARSTIARTSAIGTLVRDASKPYLEELLKPSFTR